VFGALSVNNDIYVDDIPLFTYDALGGEVLVIRIEATDPDTPDSLLTYSYESALGRQITVDDEGYARYTCLGTLYCDTITCGVSDGRTAAWKDLAVCVYDNAPRIDSMVVEQNGGRVRFTGSDTLFSLRTEKNAVVAITPHVTDRDQQDTLTRSWSSRRGVEFLFNGGQALYHAFNQPFRDTVVFSVTDRFGVKAADSLQITANEIPVIDSVRVLSSADTVTFVASNSRFEYYTDGDSLGFHVFGSDRDHIDLTFIWQHKGFYIDTVAPKTGQYRMYFDGSQTDTVIVKAFDAIGDFAVDTMIIYP